MATDVKNDQKIIFGWAMYDWANSAYATTAGAIVAAFFASTIVPCVEFDAEMECVTNAWNGFSSETIWSAVVSFGAMLLFLIMPILGAVADYNSAKRLFLRNFAILGAVFTMAVPFVPDGSVPLFLVIFLVSNVGFVAANVFYDGFLPSLTTDATIDRVSSRGYAYGYIGGGLYLAIALILFMFSGEDGITGLSESGAARVGIFGAGIWWVGFTWFALSRVPETGEASDIPPEYQHMRPWRAYASIGFGRTVSTAKKLLGFKQILLFVIAYMFYNDGTQTVISISGAYASETLELDITTIGIAFLIVQFVAFGGALFFGVLADSIGAKQAILLSLGVWTALTIAAYFLPEGQAIPFFFLAVFVGFVLGGVQALSRSLYGTMIPEEAAAEFYGFFTVFSKFSAIWGPLVFAIVSNATGSGRPAIVSVIAFFLIGGYLLSRVDIEAAQRSRAEWDLQGTEA